MGKNILAEVVTEECREYLKEIAKAKGEPQDLSILTGASSANIVCSLIVGHRFEYDDPTFKRIIETTRHFFDESLSAGIALLNNWPLLHYIPGDLFKVRQICENRREFNRLFTHHFAELKGKKEYDKSNTNSFIASYIRERNERESRRQLHTLDERNLYKCIDDLVLGGTDTTSTTLMWFVFFMLRYPEVQEKIYHDITTNFGEDTPPTWAERNRLNYVNAAIMETQRLGNVGHVALAHRSTRDSTFRGFRIPKNTVLIGYLTSVMFDENIWGPDVDTFRPDRFLDQSGQLRQVDQLIPFSIGRRSCPGQPLVRMELFLYVTSMCQRFRFVPPVPGQPPEMGEVLGLVRSPPPFKVRAVDR